MAKIVKDELIHFVKRIKSKTNVSMNKHLCDHLIWMVDEHKSLEKEVIKFKSIDRYYFDERNNLKPHTEREVDLTEKKHRLLVAMAVMKKYGYIEIHRLVIPSKEKFKRKIKHITFWKNLVIVSW